MERGAVTVDGLEELNLMGGLTGRKNKPWRK